MLRHLEANRIELKSGAWSANTGEGFGSAKHLRNPQIIYNVALPEVCMFMKTDILIVGSGCSGLYCALNLEPDKDITIITKSDAESSDSFLAQGGICMLKDEADYTSYFEDTLKAGHYENDPVSVEIMIRSSQDVISDLISYGADFARNEDGTLAFTREGGHSDKRILFHEDITGKEITSCLLARARERKNIRILEYTAMLDILCADNVCGGCVVRCADGRIRKIESSYTVLACGGIGGLFTHSTNFGHLTGDGIAAAIRHGVQLKDISYIQIHPTTLYSDDEEERSFLISESVRGEGAKLYGMDGRRFTNELLPRDVLTEKICEQMQKDGSEFVWEDLRPVPHEELCAHFPNIVSHCADKGYNVAQECIRVVPAQHYFMGGIKVGYESQTSMERLYAVGETACNGVHGKNRLASNSLLESLVFAKRAAVKMSAEFEPLAESAGRDMRFDKAQFADMAEFERENKELVLDEIKRHRDFCREGKCESGTAGLGRADAAENQKTKSCSIA